MRKFIESKLGRVAIAAVIAAGAVIGLSVAQANAADDCTSLTYPLCPRSVAKLQVVDGSLDGQEVRDGGLTGYDIADGSVPASKLNASDKAAFLKDTNTPDVKGTAKLVATYSSTEDKPLVIDKTGGSWLTRRTVLGRIVLEPGTYTLNVSAQFQRVTAAPAGVVTRPQVALRIGASDSSFGSDVGTVGGNDISPVVGGDLFGMDSHTFSVADTTTIEVSAFGYQDDRGSGDSGNLIVARALVSVLQG